MKKKYTDSIISNEHKCFVCESRGPLHWHHIFFGFNSNRDNSEEDGLKIPLCYQCHEGTDGVHGKNGRQLDLYLKRIGQEKYEETHTREEFIQRYGKSFL